jgi:hypothetical protein
MFFVENERVVIADAVQCLIVTKRDKSKMKARPQYRKIQGGHNET